LVVARPRYPHYRTFTLVELGGIFSMRDPDHVGDRTNELDFESFIARGYDDAIDETP
jgi:hypothetical protein